MFLHRVSSFYQIVMQRNLVVERAKRSLPYQCTDQLLSDYSTAENMSLACYITAQINASSVTDTGMTFQLGNGEVYDGYMNAALENGENYSVYIGVAVTLDVSLHTIFYAL